MFASLCTARAASSPPGDVTSNSGLISHTGTDALFNHLCQNEPLPSAQASYVTAASSTFVRHQCIAALAGEGPVEGPSDFSLGMARRLLGAVEMARAAMRSALRATHSSCGGDSNNEGDYQGSQQAVSPPAAIAAAYDTSSKSSLVSVDLEHVRLSSQTLAALLPNAVQWGHIRANLASRTEEDTNEWPEARFTAAGRSSSNKTAAMAGKRAREGESGQQRHSSHHGESTRSGQAAAAAAAAGYHNHSLTRSPSPPPPALRSQAKNFLSFRARVAAGNESGAESAHGARPRSPMPPRSTATANVHMNTKITPPSELAGGETAAVRPAAARAVDVDSEWPAQRNNGLERGGLSKPLCGWEAIANESTVVGGHSPAHASPLQQQHHHHHHAMSFTALRQTTLDFGVSNSHGVTEGASHSNHSNSCAYHSADDVDRERRRYAPGGHKDTIHGNYTAGMTRAGRGESFSPQQQQQSGGPRRAYFDRGADNSCPNPPANSLSPPAGFVTAGAQLLSDIKTGRASAINSSYVSHRSPALGLRRSNFQSPLQQQNPQQLPQLHQGMSGGGATMDDGTKGGSASANRVLKSIASHHNASDSGGGEAGKRVPSSSSHNKGGGGGEGRDGDDDGACGYPASLLNPDGSVPDILQPLDPKLVTQVAMEILENGAGARNVSWEDIAGLEHAKNSVEEAIIWPLRRPDLFVGLRDPPRGLLLFGPPGTGKTMIARAIANRANCTFMNMSSSALMSKWLGDGEKLVRCMFAVATVRQPTVIFIDEVDSLLSMRGEGEMDSVRRVKTEFLVQLDGVATDRGDRVLLVGATNRPDELDEAARRRMEKRLYIPLPDASGRRVLIERLLASLSPATGPNSSSTAATTGNGEECSHDGVSPAVTTPQQRQQRLAHSMTAQDLDYIVQSTEGYSGADLKLLCREAAMCPLREMTVKELSSVASGDLRPIDRRDFRQALRRIRPSVGESEVARYVEWNEQFGSFADCDGDNDEEDEEKETSSATAPMDGK